MKTLTIIVTLFFLSSSVCAGIYKWTDENGKVHYTQTPPPKDGTREAINTDNFSAVQTAKAPKIPKRTTQKAKAKKKSKKGSKSKKSKSRRRGGCRRR